MDLLGVKIDVKQNTLRLSLMIWWLNVFYPGGARNDSGEIIMRHWWEKLISQSTCQSGWIGTFTLGETSRFKPVLMFGAGDKASGWNPAFPVFWVPCTFVALTDMEFSCAIDVLSHTGVWISFPAGPVAPAHGAQEPQIKRNQCLRIPVRQPACTGQYFEITTCRNWWNQNSWNPWSRQNRKILIISFSLSFQVFT